MIVEKIGTGKSLEDAIANARSQAPAGVDVSAPEIIEHGKKGILGIFGAKDFKVKITFDDGKKAPSKKAPKKQAPKKQEAKKPEAKKQQAPKKEAKPEKKEAPAKEAKKDFPKEVNLDCAKEYFMTILAGFNVADPKIEASYAEGVITMNLECDDYGIVIGHRGETLDSIQYLLSLVMKKKTGDYVRVVINVGDYREKRAETLRHLAAKNSAYVLRTGRRYTFEPMNPYERRIIHTAVQEIEGVESRSIGFNQERRVVIEPVGGVKKQNGGYRRNSSNREKAVTKAPENHVPKKDRADLPKFGKIEVNKD